MISSHPQIQIKSDTHHPCSRNCYEGHNYHKPPRWQERQTWTDGRWIGRTALATHGKSLFLHMALHFSCKVSVLALASTMCAQWWKKTLNGWKCTLCPVLLPRIPSWPLKSKSYGDIPPLSDWIRQLDQRVLSRCITSLTIHQPLGRWSTATDC